MILKCFFFKVKFSTASFSLHSRKSEFAAHCQQLPQPGFTLQKSEEVWFLIEYMQNKQQKKVLTRKKVN